MLTSLLSKKEVEKTKRFSGLFYEVDTTITTGVDELLPSQENM
jgi:hypothetical protein